MGERSNWRHTNTIKVPLLIAALAALGAGCGTGDASTPSSSSGGTSGGTSGSSGTSGGADASTKGLPADCPGGDEGGAVPGAAEDLNAWLQKRAYTCWARESQVHRSQGPHGGNVRVYLNAALDGSLAKGDAEHPAASVAVKELYGDGTDTVTGWAVSVKTDAASASGQGWFWYEVFSVDPGAAPVAASNGEPLCANCHSGGTDFVLITHPLR